MYGFPKDLDSEVFIDRTLSPVSYAEYQIMLYFDEGLMVTAYTTIYYRLPGGREEPEHPGTQTGNLVALVGKSVTRCQGNTQELILWFGEESHIRLVDDSEQYECYVIDAPGLELRV